MSIFPCDRHGTRVRGPLDAAYVTVLSGTARYSRRLRLCSECLRGFLDTHSNVWQEVSDNPTLDKPTLCSTCAAQCNEPSSDLPVFVTVYARGNERQDLYGAVHSACGPSFCEAMGLSETA